MKVGVHSGGRERAEPGFWQSFVPEDPEADSEFRFGKNAGTGLTVLPFLDNRNGQQEPRE